MLLLFDVLIAEIIFSSLKQMLIWNVCRAKARPTIRKQALSYKKHSGFERKSQLPICAHLCKLACTYPIAPKKISLSKRVYLRWNNHLFDSFEKKALLAFLPILVSTDNKF